MPKIVLLAAFVLLTACKITKPVEVASANEADATLVLQYEHGFEDYKLEWGDAETHAIQTCSSWGYSAVEFSESGTIECIEWYERKITGAAPPGQSEEPSLGTRAGQRERDNRNLGTVGQSVRTASSPPGAEYGCVRWRVTYVARCVE